MELTKNDVSQYQKLYKTRFGKDLDYQAAYKQLSMLVRQMEIVYQPITKEQLKSLNKRVKSKKKK